MDIDESHLKMLFPVDNWKCIIQNAHNVDLQKQSAMEGNDGNVNSVIVRSLFKEKM